MVFTWNIESLNIPSQNAPAFQGMDSSEAAKIVHERIRQLEPNVANKILGYLFLQEVPHQELIRLALGPDALILNLIQNAKSSFLVLPSPQFNPFPPRYFPNGTDTFNSVKSCHYFNRGYCKHGNNCRYSHVGPFPDTTNYPVMFYEDKHMLHPFSLEKLEMEIVELLKSRKCYPISIASLPMMYFEMYGRTLQAEGYLTESQRHGKAGYNLTRLLAQLKNIRLIDRPHGQHAVMLAEHAPKYLDIRADRCYSNIQAAVNGSRQLYLTFPAESIFNEEDVSAYFSTFGPVQDVRIPFQQKRMFGFVTFVSAYTVKCILSQGNPHYICGARVLVKPYREKSKLAERKYLKKLEPPVSYQPHAMDIESELESRFFYNLSRRRFMVEQNQALELETRHLSRLQISPNPLISSVDEQKYSVDNFSDRESSQGLNLPDSPFTSSISAM